MKDHLDLAGSLLDCMLSIVLLPLLLLVKVVIGCCLLFRLFRNRYRLYLKRRWIFGDAPRSWVFDWKLRPAGTKAVRN